MFTPAVSNADGEDVDADAPPELPHGTRARCGACGRTVGVLSGVLVEHLRRPTRSLCPGRGKAPLASTLALPARPAMPDPRVPATRGAAEPKTSRPKPAGQAVPRLPRAVCFACGRTVKLAPSGGLIRHTNHRIDECCGWVRWNT